LKGKGGSPSMKRFSGAVWHRQTNTYGSIIVVLLLLLLSVPALLNTPRTYAAKPATVQHSLQNVSTQAPGVYYGVNVQGLSPTDFSSLTQFETDAQKPVALVMFFTNWGGPDPTTSEFNSALMTAIRNHGSVPMITWDPWVFGKGPDQPTYSLKNIVAGNFDTYITQYAQAAKAWGHPFFLRFAQEMNASWYPWGFKAKGMNNKVADYRNAWIHIHNIFTQVGATNVSWTWTPATWDGEGNLFSILYPGDSYVDWVGLSGYNWAGSPSTWKSFSNIFRQSLGYLTAITSKPVLIAETASNEAGGSKANWITDLYDTQIPTHFPQIKAIIWYNRATKSQWWIESSVSATQAFAAAIQNPLYASNQFAGITTSPIPPLS
jgi:beta-mannanase